MNDPNPKVTIDFWNVGQGDATSIRLPTGELILIDVGPRGSTLSQWLREKPRGLIREILLTHNDTDHTGALPEIVADGNIDVKRVRMLEDRDRSNSVQDKLFRTVFEISKNRDIKVERLECPPGRGTALCEVPPVKLSLRLYHPTFEENYRANTPNATSAILALEQDGNTLVVWPGDARLAKVADVIDGPICLLFGPHHGAPQDPKRTDQQNSIDQMIPNNCLISVGTQNGHNHPSPKYIKDLNERGCRVKCTQMTCQCDRERVNKKQHLMNSSGYFALPAPKTGVFCRGHVRLTATPTELVFDRYHEEHTKRLDREARRRRRILCVPA